MKKIQNKKNSVLTDSGVLSSVICACGYREIEQEKEQVCNNCHITSLDEIIVDLEIKVQSAENRRKVCEQDYKSFKIITEKEIKDLTETIQSFEFRIEKYKEIISLLKKPLKEDD
jgi:transcription initiation factor IIF auxiliary subunit